MRDQALDLWEELQLASELEYGLRDTVNWDRNWFVYFNSGKTQLVLPDTSNKTGEIDVK